jgi:hypothetical protein
MNNLGNVESLCFGLSNKSIDRFEQLGFNFPWKIHMDSQKNIARGPLKNFILSHIVSIYKLDHICDFERSLT